MTTRKATQWALYPHLASEPGRQEVSMASSSESTGLFFSSTFTFYLVNTVHSKLHFPSWAISLSDQTLTQVIN